jgi:hypothetical protein
MMNLWVVQIAFGSHLSRGVLTRLASGELSPTGRRFAEGHLKHCEQCQEACRSLASAVLRINEYRQSLIERLNSSAQCSLRRGQFIRQLDTALQSVETQPWWKPSSLWSRTGAIQNSVPVRTSALVALFAGVILFFFWRGQPPSVSAAELLNRAIASDSSSMHSRCVIRRRFRITSRVKTIEHAVYRDPSGRRQPKHEKGSVEEADFATLLAQAGVDWDDPLSAASFKAWHDRQAGPRDEVNSSVGNLLQISTLLPSTNIAKESLTVERGNFHPIERIIEYRDSGSVSISEVGIEVLTWDKTSEQFFEPKPLNTVVARHSHAVPPSPPNTAQLDEAELQARLILNEQRADTGEQIEFARGVDGVRIQGLVESEARKQELNNSLQGIPFLKASIRSFGDLRSDSDSGAQISSIQQKTVVAQTSPLEEYFVERGRSRDDLSRISAGLFNCSLVINRLSRSLEQLTLRFSGSMGLSPTALRARDELLSRSVAQLLDSLKQQKQLLDETGIGFEPSPMVSEVTEANGPKLVLLAERNMAATRALISSNGAPKRSEKETAAELAETISELRTAGSTCMRSLVPQPLEPKP